MPQAWCLILVQCTTIIVRGTLVELGYANIRMVFVLQGKIYDSGLAAPPPTPKGMVAPTPGPLCDGRVGRARPPPCGVVVGGVGGACVQGRVSKSVARTSKPKVLEMFRHSQEDRTLFEAGSKMSNYVSTAAARADRESSPPEKQTKRRKNDMRIKTHLRFRFSAKSGSKGKPKTCKNLTTRSPERLAKPLQGNYRFLRKW